MDIKTAIWKDYFWLFLCNKLISTSTNLFWTMHDYLIFSCNKNRFCFPPPLMRNMGPKWPISSFYVVSCMAVFRWYVFEINSIYHLLFQICRKYLVLFPTNNHFHFSFFPPIIHVSSFSIVLTLPQKIFYDNCELHKIFALVKLTLRVSTFLVRKQWCWQISLAGVRGSN